MGQLLRRRDIMGGPDDPSATFRFCTEAEMTPLDVARTLRDMTMWADVRRCTRLGREVRLMVETASCVGEIVVRPSPEAV